MAVFSATVSLSPQERPSPPIELQLLPVEELMSLWEQTQQAAWAMEEKGFESGTPLQYSHMVVWEMQRRLSLHPDLCFGSTGDLGRADPEHGISGVADASSPLPHIMTVHM